MAHDGESCSSGHPECDGPGRDPALRRELRTRGWTVFRILADAATPPFAYTLGLDETFGHPELLAFAEHERGSRLLHALAARVRDGERFRDGERRDDVPEAGGPCAFRAVPERHQDEWMGRAFDYAGGRPFPALQCLLADAAGRLPEEPGAEPTAARAQPVLADMPRWPFEESRDTPVETTRAVLEGQRPVRYACRRPGDGLWRFADGGTGESAEPEPATLMDVFRQDPSVAAIAGLAPGQEAERRKPGSRWRVRPLGGGKRGRRHHGRGQAAPPGAAWATFAERIREHELLTVGLWEVQPVWAPVLRAIREGPWTAALECACHPDEQFAVPDAPVWRHDGWNVLHPGDVGRDSADAWPGEAADDEDGAFVLDSWSFPWLRVILADGLVLFGELSALSNLVLSFHTADLTSAARYDALLAFMRAIGSAAGRITWVGPDMSMPLDVLLRYDPDEDRIELGEAWRSPGQFAD